MDKMRKSLIIFLFFSCTIYGQNMQIWPEIKGLTEFTINSMGSKEWYGLNYSFDRHYYIDEFGNISIKKEEEIYQYLFEYGNGTFIGTNNGEWGGKLVFKNKTQEYTILTENICGIINYNNGIYILTGLSHLGISEGKIIKLEIINGRWECTFFIEFNSSPEIYKIYDDKLFIVTFNGLIVFDGNNIQQLLTEQFWSSLYPKTMYVNDEIIAIGLRGCIAIINRKNNSVKYYK